MNKTIGIFVDNNLNHDVRVKKQISQYQRLGFEIKVLCFEYHPSDKKNDSILPYQIKRIKLSKRLRNGLKIVDGRTNIYGLLLTHWACKFLKSYEVAIFHVHDLYLSKPCANAIRKCGSKAHLILDLHENYPEAVTHYGANKSNLTKWLFNAKKWKTKEKSFLACTQVIITLSKSFQKDLQKKYKELQNHRFVVLPNTLDIGDFEASQKKETIKIPWKGINDPTFVYFGVIAKRRGIHLTLKAFRELNEEGVKVNLLLIGPIDKSEKHEIQQEMNFLSKKGCLCHIPWINLNDLESYLTLSDVALSPLEKNKQHESGIANKIFQYMYGSLPIISSDCRPQKDLIQDNDIGSIFYDLESYKKAILLYLKKETSVKMGKKARKVLEEKFDYRSTDLLLKSCIESLLAQTPQT